MQGNKAACTSAICVLRTKQSSPCGRDPLSQRVYLLLLVFHHSSSHNKTWDGCYYGWWAPWWGTTPSHVFKVTFGQLCPEAALACGWWGVHGAFPSIWDSFLDHLEGNKPHCLQTSVGFFSTWVFWIHSFFFCWKWKLSCIIARSSQSLQCWGQPKLKHELPLQAHPGDNHPKADWKQSPVQTLELQSLSSALKGFWRDVRRHLPAPPAPGSSAACRGCPAPRALHPLPPQPLKVGGSCCPPPHGATGVAPTRSAQQLSLDWRHPGRSSSHGIKATR